MSRSSPPICLRGSFLVEADLGRSNLAHTSFAGAYIRNANFTNADLSGVDLTEADWFNALGLTQAQLTRVRHDTVMECLRRWRPLTTAGNPVVLSTCQFSAEAHMTV